MQGVYAYCSYIPSGVFHITSLCMHDTRSAIRRNELIRYTLSNVHVTWFTNTLREKFSLGISEPFL